MEWKNYELGLIDSQKQGGDHIKTVNLDATEINKIKKQAQEIIKTQGIQLKDYVAVIMKNEKGQEELLWFVVCAVGEKEIVGELDNDPIYKHKIKFGKPKEIQNKDIVDIIKGIHNDK